MTTILRDAGLSRLLPAGAALERLAGGFQFTEGPLWIPGAGGAGSVLFQDEKAWQTLRVGLEPGSKAEVFRDGTRGANGQTFLPDGRIVFCEQDGRRVSVMNADGSGVATVTETWQGKRLNSPNDIICRSDGLVYFTDPPYGVKDEDRSISFQGVYSLRVGGGGGGHSEPTLLLDDFEKPNGLALSPDERTLYVNDTGRYQIRAFEVDEAGGLVPGSGRVVATPDPAEKGGPDGLKVDRAGRLYAAVAEGVWVYEPAGAGEPFRLLGVIAVPKRPANLAWCGRGGGTLFLTAVDTVYAVRLNVEGVLPPFTP